MLIFDRITNIMINALNSFIKIVSKTREAQNLIFFFKINCNLAEIES